MNVFYCPDCDTSYSGPTEHVCDLELKRIAELEREVAMQVTLFDYSWANFLGTPLGRFAMYYAQRLIRGSTGPNNTLVV